MITNWLVAIVIALILLKTAHSHKRKVNSSQTMEGAAWQANWAYIFALGALAFVVIAVVLAAE